MEESGLMPFGCILILFLEYSKISIMTLCLFDYFLKCIINTTYLMSDDLKQMLAALTINAQNQTKLMQQQSTMLQQHGKTLEEYGNKFEKIEKRLDKLEGGYKSYGKTKKETVKHGGDTLSIEHLCSVKWRIKYYRCS